MVQIRTIDHAIQRYSFNMDIFCHKKSATA